MGLRFIRVGGGGGSWKLAVVYLNVHAPSKNRARFRGNKHTSLITSVGEYRAFALLGLEKIYVTVVVTLRDGLRVD
jgi:hypothetical protein